MANFTDLFDLTETQLTTIENLIKEEPESAWTLETYRQDNYKMHQETGSIILKLQNRNEKHPIAVDNAELISKYSILDELYAKAAEILGFSKYIVTTSLFVKLPAGNQVYKHKDSFEVFKYINRIHVPIITNAECLFTIGEETKSIEKGKATQVDNMAWHSVENKSSVDRVHLIFDIKADLS
jgi:aspartyl/asparaginyl beta-hydroxylase (cupin superfamily)